MTVENDARCFTLAEARYGAGRGARDVCGLALGTGVGCGVMVGGRLHRGATAQAGEVYHIQLRGQSVEYFVAGAGDRAGLRGRGGPRRRRISTRRRSPTGPAPSDAAAVAAWRSFGDDLAFLCEAVIGLLDPEVIVIGGSLARAGDLFKPALLPALEKHATRIAMPSSAPRPASSAPPR